MAETKIKEILTDISKFLEKEYRGINIAVYTIASIGLATAIHKVRPVSKFSNPRQVPSHFVRRHEELNGVFAGVQQNPTQLLIDHKAPIYLPFWHSSKPPLPVKLWGVDIVSGHATSWLQCLAVGNKVTFKPISKQDNDLYSSVVLHLPKEGKKKQFEMLDVGKKLVELGYAKTSVPKLLPKESIETVLAPALVSAEKKAINYRNGIWSERLPPLPFYIIYGRKLENFIHYAFVLLINTSWKTVVNISKITLRGLKTLVLMPFSRKQQVPNVN